MFAVGFFIWVCKPNFFDLYFSQIIKLSHFPPQACSCHQSKVYFLLFFLKYFFEFKIISLKIQIFSFRSRAFSHHQFNVCSWQFIFPAINIWQHFQIINLNRKSDLPTNKKLVFTFTNALNLSWLTFLYLLFMFFLLDIYSTYSGN